MNTTMLSKFLYCVAIGVIIIAIKQWFFDFPDISQLAFGLTGALVLLLAGYTHSGFRNLVQDIKKEKEEKNKKIKELNNALDRAIDYTREVDDKFSKK